VSAETVAVATTANAARLLALPPFSRAAAPHPV
jgi:hypothetical protein